jgi:transcriptional regulator with XRE-family HTH domain
MMRLDPDGLRRWRERELMTRNDLAYKSGVSYATVCSVENGKRVGMISLRKILECMDMDWIEADNLGLIIHDAPDGPGKEPRNE